MARGGKVLFDAGWRIRDGRLREAAVSLRTGIGRLRNGPILTSVGNQNGATAALCEYEHGSPMWRLLVCIASGKVTREDLRILAEVVEALADG